MEIYELILIITGSILFVFALALVVFLLKNQKPYTNAIWLILIAFFMMGFSAISNAEVFGLFKYEKEKKLSEIEALSDASQICPDNIVIKTMLMEKIDEYESTEKIKSAEENAVLGYAYYSIGNQTKAIQYSEKALSKDDSNKKAKGVIELAKTRKLIEESPEINNKERLKLELKDQIKSLEENPNIDPIQIDRLKEDIKNDRELLKVGPGGIIKQ